MTPEIKAAIDAMKVAEDRLSGEGFKISAAKLAAAREGLEQIGFALTLNLDNDAFQESYAPILDILQHTRGRLIGGITEGSIRDINGNTVGAYACRAPSED